MAKWLGAFILACLGLATACVQVFDGSIAAGFNFFTEYLKVAVALGVPQGVTPPSTLPTSYLPEAQTVYIQITDALSGDQIGETTQVFLGDPQMLVGEFNLTATQRSGAITVATQATGQSPYMLRGNVVLWEDGSARRYVCNGEGYIDVRPFASFSVRLARLDRGAGACVIRLE
jgi:hypothetical protein